MIVGCPAEVKSDEYRVGLRPVGAELLARDGHTVLVQSGAGVGSGYEDEQYAAYRDIIAASPRRKITIRTLDVGGDKQVAYLGGTREAVEQAVHHVRGQRVHGIGPVHRQNRHAAVDLLQELAHHLLRDPVIAPMVSELAQRRNA